jgi:hypothetical protein
MMRMRTVLVLWSAVRILLAMVIYLLDLVLKFALGHFLVYLIWLPFHRDGETRYGVGWLVAGGILGLFITGLSEGCDIIFNGWAKRVAGDPQAAE